MGIPLLGQMRGPWRGKGPTLNEWKAPSLPGAAPASSHRDGRGSQQVESPKDRVCFQQRASLDVTAGVPQITKRAHYQAEGPQHCQAPLPGCAQLYQAHGDNDAVKYVPLLLEVIVGVQGYDFEDHFSSEKHSKYLQTETGIHLSGVCEVVGNDKRQGRNVLFIEWQTPLLHFYSLSISSADS